MSVPSFGIQSWCYRHFKTIPEFTQQLKAAGVSATELCGVQADFNKPETFDSVIEQFKQAQVKILSIGVQGIFGKPEERNYFEFCRKAGVKYMSVTFKPDGMWDAFKHAEKLAEEYDIQLGIHNHGGYDWLGNATILDYIFKHTSKRIGLTLDTAWAIDAKQDSVKLVEQFADRLVGVHIKDFTYTPDRMPHDVVIGTGNLDLPGFVKTLDKVGFKGFTVIEYEGDVENPVPALSECVKILSGLMK
jgi:sugar phosphate isomerase/epimerase